MKQKRLKICLLEPYYGGSHRRWADEYKRFSGHKIEILPLEPRHWKWRMHGAAVTFARELESGSRTYDLIIANDMMDVAVFISLIRGRGIQTPVVTYFHENQISYPVSPNDTDRMASRDAHYGYINYTTALASGAVFFNSEYHRRTFLDALPGFLSRFPDHQNLDTVSQIGEKSRVLPLSMDLRGLDLHKPDTSETRSTGPLILWNHRWEHDKQPGEFLDILLELHQRGLPFGVVLLGTKLEEADLTVHEKIERLGDRVLHKGGIEDSAAYAEWLWRANILPVTSIQDFFGGSVVEAVYCGCHPVLPKRLAYPEHFPDAPVFYESGSEAVDLLSGLIRSGDWQRPSPLSESVQKYDWSGLAGVYDQAMIEM